MGTFSRVPGSGVSEPGWTRRSDRFSATPVSWGTWWFRGMGELTLYPDQRDSEPALRSGKSLALLAYVALSPGGRTPRQHLAELLWPDLSRRSQQHSLRQSLYRLRQATSGRPLVRSRGHEVEQCPGVRFDFREGELALTSGDYGRAEKLLRGEFLEGFSIPEAREFERWAESKRAGFRSSWAQAARTLAEQRLTEGELAAAVDIAEILAARRPFDEEAIRLLMAALAGSGQYALAVARFRAYARLVRAELGREPSAELRRYAGELDGCAGSTALRPNAEPTYAGRSDEWAVLEETWRSVQDWDGTLVLVKGGARVRKTRLLNEFSDRVRAGGAIVLSTRCSGSENRVPYGSVVRALRPVASLPGLERLDRAWLTEVARLLPGLRERFPDLPEPDPADGGWASTFRLRRALANCLRDLGGPDGLLVMIDDLHRADGASLELLQFLARDLRGTRTLVLTACRPDDLGPAGRRFVRSIVSERLVRLIVLRDPGAEDALMGRAFGRGSGQPSADESVDAYLERFSRGDRSLLDGLMHALWKPRESSLHGREHPLRRRTDFEALQRTLHTLLSAGDSSARDRFGGERSPEDDVSQ